MPLLSTVSHKSKCDVTALCGLLNEGTEPSAQSNTPCHIVSHRPVGVKHAKAGVGVTGDIYRE